jgi:XTP/dITP diphosphohydrolase
MEQLIFATNNPNKVKEVNAILGEGFKVLSLKEAGIDVDIPEPHDTLEANALEKAATIYGLTGKSCFSEDTGLEVSALGGAPGVRSARYAGEKAKDADNISLLLNNLQGETDREARFRTVISLILNGEQHTFEGICEGTIIATPTGTRGFGYDPVFVPTGADKTFAEMEMEEKNRFSHRKKAIQQLVQFFSGGKV